MFFEHLRASNLGYEAGKSPGLAKHRIGKSTADDPLVKRHSKSDEIILKQASRSSSSIQNTSKLVLWLGKIRHALGTHQMGGTKTARSLLIATRIAFQ